MVVGVPLGVYSVLLVRRVLVLFELRKLQQVLVLLGSSIHPTHTHTAQHPFRSAGADTAMSVSE